MKFVLGALLLPVLAGCASPAVTSPLGVDLSGTWQLDVQHSQAGALPDDRTRSDADERQLPGSREAPASPGGLTAEPDSDEPTRGPLPRLPMLSATQMTIAQDPTSMGIDYPGQPYRDLKWATRSMVCSSSTPVGRA